MLLGAETMVASWAGVWLEGGLVRVPVMLVCFLIRVQGHRCVQFVIIHQVYTCILFSCDRFYCNEKSGQDSIRLTLTRAPIPAVFKPLCSHGQLINRNSNGFWGLKLRHMLRCIVRRFCHWANIIECRYTSLDGTVYYTPGCTIAYCSQVTGLYSTSLFKTTQDYNHHKRQWCNEETW